ncbi:MAG: hypothetical protein R2687_00675 [Candidatus Nanopelagicales bacterium]
MRNRSSSSIEVEAGFRCHEVVDQSHGQFPRGDPDSLVEVAVDHVVLTRYISGAGLAPADFVASLGLQLQRHMLGHVTEPGALPQPFEEPATTSGGTGMLTHPGQDVDQPVHEPGDPGTGPLFEFAEVHQ